MTGRWRTRIGIQIGERHIRAVVVQKRGSGWVTVRQAADSLPGGIVRGGGVLQPNLLGLRLKAMLRENGIRAGRVSVFLEDLPLFVRRFTFPPMTKSELAKAVEYKMKLELPVDADDFFIRHVPVEARRGEEGGRPAEYAVAAVRKTSVRRLEEALRSAGLSALAVGLEPEAAYWGLAALERASGTETFRREPAGSGAASGAEAAHREPAEPAVESGTESVRRAPAARAEECGAGTRPPAVAGCGSGQRRNRDDCENGRKPPDAFDPCPGQDGPCALSSRGWHAGGPGAGNPQGAPCLARRGTRQADPEDRAAGP